MVQDSVERRRGRRVSLEAPLLIRRVGVRELQPFKELVAKNVSLAGVYFETEGEDTYALNEFLMASVAIPETFRRDFPFTRLAGPSRVVRVKQLPWQEAEGKTRFGIALEFGDKITALTASPSRG